MSLSYSERLILLKACIVRRTTRTTWITSEALLKALQEDHELVRTRTPQHFFQDSRKNISQELDAAVDEELVEASGKGGMKYQRTSLGDIFLRSLETRLAVVLDEMPMSGEDILDFLSRI